MTHEDEKPPVAESAIPPLVGEPDASGAGWERPSWQYLAWCCAVLLYLHSLTLPNGPFMRNGWVTAAHVVRVVLLLVPVVVLVVASKMVDAFLAAPHVMPLTDDEAAWLEAHADATSEAAEKLRRTAVIGRMLTGREPDSFEAYFAALTDDDMAAIRQNRAAMTEACWEWKAGLEEAEVSITADDGVHLVGHILAAAEPSSKWAVCVHGYCGCYLEMTQYAYAYARRGYNILLPDLRGHGKSGGRYIGMGALDSDDLVCWLQWLVNTYGAHISLVLHGHSMGGATVLLAAAEEDVPEQVRAVVSDCAYSDALNVFGPVLQSMGLPAHPTLELARLALKLKHGGYDLAEAAPEKYGAGVEVPVLLVHGERDTFVPPYMAARIERSLTKSPQVQRMMVPGAGHCQSVFRDPEGYWGAVWEFLGEVKRKG